MCAGADGSSPPREGQPLPRQHEHLILDQQRDCIWQLDVFAPGHRLNHGMISGEHNRSRPQENRKQLFIVVLQCKGERPALALLLENVRGQRNAEDLATTARLPTSILLEEGSEQPHRVLFASSCLSIELPTLRSGH